MWDWILMDVVYVIFDCGWVVLDKIVLVVVEELCCISIGVG